MLTYSMLPIFMLLNLHKKFTGVLLYTGGVLNTVKARSRIYLTNTVYIEHRFYYTYISFIIVQLFDYRTISFFILKLMSDYQLKVMKPCVVLNIHFWPRNTLTNNIKSPVISPQIKTQYVAGVAPFSVTKFGGLIKYSVYICI